MKSKLVREYAVAEKLYHTVAVLVCPKLAGYTGPVFNRQIPSPLVAGDGVLTVERETFLQTN